MTNWPAARPLRPSLNQGHATLVPIPFGPFFGTLRKLALPPEEERPTTTLYFYVPDEFPTCRRTSPHPALLCPCGLGHAYVALMSVAFLTRPITAPSIH